MTTTAYAVRRNQNLSRAATATRLGPVSVSFVTIAIISVLALLYLTQITKTSVFGYKLSEANARHDKLQMVHQELQVEAARLRSVKSIAASSQAGSMVSEQNVSFAK